MRWILPLFGFAMVAIAMQDLFHTLFHPSEQGNVSEYMTLRIWRWIRRFAPSKVRFVGPANFVVVILYWGMSVIIGFALFYRPFLPNLFVPAPGIDISRFISFGGALALSLSSVITVGIGIQANSIWIEIVMGIEAVLGFAILTASISWILSIYPVIEHRRSLAYEISLLHFTEERGIRSLDKMPDSELQTMLLGLAEQIATIRVELSQFPITYYFQERDEKSALAPALYYIAEVARDITASDRGPVVAATVLGGCIDDLLQLIEEKYLRRSYGNRWATLQAFSKDHARTPLHRPRVKNAA